MIDRSILMKAAELYRALEAELGSTFGAHGFKKRRAARLAFQRRFGDKYHTIWFQADRSGWDTYAGSSFFVNFSVTPSPAPEDPARRAERLNYFLTDAELIQAREYRDALVARIPRPPESYFQTLEQHFAKTASTASDLVATIRARFEPESIPYRRHQDFGLRYWTLVDVQGWALFVGSILPRAIKEMESW